MPRYFFHIREGEINVPDDEGVDLEDLECAKHEALASAREMVAQKIRDGQPLNAVQITITDEAGTYLGSSGVADILKD